jgi:hypothetical protein
MLRYFRNAVPWLLLLLLTASDPTVTDYILKTPAKCRNCRREIREKTLVEPVPL